MDNKKFEQLIDMIINENEEQARALFHDIVVEKSREIYESIMDEEMGQDQVSGLIDEIAAEEEGISEEEDEFADIGDEEGDEEVSLDSDDIDGGEEAGEEDLEDRVVDLEDKLDELMAEFEELMAGEEGEEEHADMDDEEAGEEAGEEMMESEDEESESDGDDTLEEAVQLQKVSVTHGDNGQNTKSIVSGGPKVGGNGAKAVAAGGAEEKGRTAPAVKDIPGNYKNAPGQKGQKLDSAPKAKAGDDGQNTKSVVGEGKKSTKKIVK
jgi:hypothetical protein